MKQGHRLVNWSRTIFDRFLFAVNAFSGCILLWQTRWKRPRYTLELSYCPTKETFVTEQVWFVSSVYQVKQHPRSPVKIRILVWLFMTRWQWAVNNVQWCKVILFYHTLRYMCTFRIREESKIVFDSNRHWLLLCMCISVCFSISVPRCSTCMRT